MAYFPHNREDEFGNPRLNRFEGNYPTSKSRNYSPDDKDKITQRIIRYFEDPKEVSALAEIKRLSNKAKKSSKDVRSSLGDFIGNDNLKNNTELNRVMFKNEGGDYQLEQSNARDPFKRRKFKFSTQRYVPKNKNMTLIDEIRIKQNENNENGENQYKRKKDNRIIRFSVDKGIDDDNQEVNNKNKDYNNNASKPVSNHTSNFRRYKKLKSENIARPRFHERKQEFKPKGDDEPKKIEIVEGTFDTIPEEYKEKNNATVENLHNKEQIVINEYHTKGRNPPKNYKTEYVWDKSINRLVEKRIYLDKNELDNNNNSNNKNEERKYNNNSVNYRNRYKRLDDENDDNREKKENKYENEEKEEKKRVNLKYNKNRKYKNYDTNNNENKNKDENEDNEIVVRKRFGNSTVILKKDNITKNKKDINPDQNNTNKGNRFYKRYRNYKTENKEEEEEKPKQEEIIIEKTTVIEKIENTKYETPEKGKENSNEKPRRIYKKRLNNLILNDDKDGIEKNYEKNLTEAYPKKEHKYSKRPYYQPSEPLTKTIYTKKKISEEIPKKEVPIEKKYERNIEKYEEKKPVEVEVKEEEKEKEKDEPKKKFEKKVPKVNPYSKYKKKNMRIKTGQDDSDEEIEDKKPKVYNTAYSNYIKNKRKANDKKAHKARTTSELIDDLEKIENYNANTYLKDDLLEIYDNMHEQCNDFKNDIFYTNINSFEVNVGEFDKYKIPFLKKKTKAEDLCRGRVTSEDIYRKYSQNAKKYEKKRLYE